MGTLDMLQKACAAGAGSDTILLFPQLVLDQVEDVGVVRRLRLKCVRSFAQSPILIPAPSLGEHDERKTVVSHLHKHAVASGSLAISDGNVRS